MKIRLALLVGVVFLLVISSRPGGQIPTPEPPPGELDLSGAFNGETAADDAATVSCLAGELADVIEYDQMQPEPILKTGITLDELRKRSRAFRCDGESLSDKHPELARRVGVYLDEKLGNNGGPVSTEQLGRWIAAYREIERAAASVVR